MKPKPTPARKTLAPLTALALVFLGLLMGLSIVKPFVVEPSEQDIAVRLLGPSWAHLMGTDALGRDLLSRISDGARLSLATGVLTALVALVFGTTIGGLAGWKGGITDRTLVRIIDVFSIFPSVLLAILLTVFVGRGFMGILLALGLTGWMQLARLVRAQVMQMKEYPWVEAARAVGAPEWRILLHHLLPNLWSPILISLAFQIPTSILSESFLSFIGLGLEPPLASWGTLAAEGFRAMKSYPHLILFPGGILFATLLSFQLLAEGLRRTLDPRDASRLQLGGSG
jgi:oligopeptide transport system permease protein